MPGRKPTPTYLKLLRGNPGRRPLPQNEPQLRMPSVPPEPPSWLGDEAQQEWWRIVPGLHACGLLTIIDINPLAAYCQAYDRWRRAEEALAAMAARDTGTTGALVIRAGTGLVMTNPLVNVAGKAMKDMVRFASEFGLTPRARSLIASGHLAKTMPPNKFAGLINGQSERDDET